MYTYLPSSDTASDIVCRWFDRVVYLQIQTVSLLPFIDPQIYSLAIARQCFWQSLPWGRSSILSAALGWLHTSEYQSTNMLTCLRPTLSLWVFAVGSIEYSLCKYRQFDNVLIPFHTYAHLWSPDTVSDSVCLWLDRVFFLHLWAVSLLPVNSPQIYSLAIAWQCLWRVFRCLDRAFSLQFYSVCNIQISLKCICSLAIARRCLRQCLPLARSCILFASLGS